MHPLTVNINIPLSKVSLSVVIEYGKNVVSCVDIVLNVKDWCKHGLEYVLKTYDSLLSTLILMVLYCELYLSFTYDALKSTVERSKFDLIGVFSQENNAKTEINNTFFMTNLFGYGANIQ